MSDAIKIYALGGLGEFGKNLMVLQQDQDVLIVDCGALFSDGRNPGIDIIIPDFEPLMDQSLNIHGILLTHAHEDHIGSVPYFLSRKNVPVYGTKFTQALVQKKCNQFYHKLKLDFHLINENDELDIGPFHITPVAMAHSIAEALGFFIDTKMGTWFHTGDFKIDPNPADGWKTDIEKIKTIASRKDMLLLTSDSTNVLVPGESKSETSIQGGIQKAFDETKGILVVTSFASHLPRIFQLCNLAVKNKRKVFLLGRSIVDNVELGKRLGHMRVPESVFVSEKEAQLLDPSELLIIATGTQAEPRAALSKLTFGQIKGFKLQENDRVVFSSRAIPGHERAIYHLINHIYRTGADVWTWADEHIHVSGHGYRQDLEKIIKLVKPKYMLPVHGELRMLRGHQRLAIECGIPKENTFFIENGDPLVFDENGVTQLDRVELHAKLVDRGMLVEMGAQYLKERRKLAEYGALLVVLTVDEDGKTLLHEPFLEHFGFVDEKISQEVLDDIADGIEREFFKLQKKPFHGNLEQQLRMWVNRICKKHLSRKPVILPMIIDA